MKRHEALIPLSRDHHEALILSRLIQRNAPAYKGLPGDIDGKANYACNFFTSDLVKHFLEEENVFQVAKGFLPEMDSLIDELVNEHDRLAKMFDAIPISTDKGSDLDALGKFLENHIRTEERILFPMMQENLDEQRFAEILELTNRDDEK